MTSRSRRRSTLAIATVWVLAACHPQSTDGSRVPTEGEARAVLAQYVAATRRTHTAEEYCAAAAFDEMCESAFARAGGVAAVPTAAPTVVSASRTVGRSIRVLVVCGVSGTGEPYRSDFPVHYDDTAKLQATLPVFWNGTAFDGVRSPGAVVTASAGSDPPDYAGC